MVLPGKVFSPNWHLQVICEHLEAVTAGEITRLLINIPPRHSKSTIVNVMWPMWEWITRPQEQYLCASYAGHLAIRDSVASRRLVTSGWYQGNWGNKFQLTGDQNQKIRWENDKSGYRIATSTSGLGTGEGGSRLVCDDPIGARDAQSDLKRESTLEWWDMVWSTRLNDPMTDAMILVMQRVHEEDPSGHVLKDIGGWEHICIPAEYDGVKRTTSLGAYDPRKVEGELLWPTRFGASELEVLKKSLGIYGTSGQLQQDPSPPGGGILRVERFRLLNKVPQCFYIVQSLDTAYEDGQENDDSAFLVFGVFKLPSGKNGVLLLDAWGEQLTYPVLRSRLVGDKESGKKGEWLQEYGGSLENGTLPRRADVILIEKKGSGISLMQDLQSAGVPVVAFNPGNASKVNRAHQAAPIVELDVIYLLASQLEGQEAMPVTWARKMVEQCRKFPVGAHDDFVDAFTQAMIYLRSISIFDLAFVPDDPVEDRDYYSERKRRQNPYSV